MWAILFQFKLTDKAQEACSSLSIEDSMVYDKVKSTMLVYTSSCIQAYTSYMMKSLGRNGSCLTASVLPVKLCSLPVNGLDFIVGNDTSGGKFHSRV